MGALSCMVLGSAGFIMEREVLLTMNSLAEGRRP
jgi:hypothetical protein